MGLEVKGFLSGLFFRLFYFLPPASFPSPICFWLGFPDPEGAVVGEKGSVCLMGAESGRILLMGLARGGVC